MNTIYKLFLLSILCLTGVACADDGEDLDGGTEVKASFVACLKSDSSQLSVEPGVTNSIDLGKTIYLMSTSTGATESAKWILIQDGRIFEIIYETNGVVEYKFTTSGVFDLKMVVDDQEIALTEWVNVIDPNDVGTDPDDGSGSVTNPVPSEPEREWGVFPIDYVTCANGYWWVLNEDISDEFQTAAAAQSEKTYLNDKWKNYYHADWSGPAPTLWKYDHVWIDDSKMKIKATRPENPGTVEITSGDVTGVVEYTWTGCATCKTKVSYPAYIEAYAKLSKSSMASDVWMLSSDNTQEIDIIEAYGGDRTVGYSISDQESKSFYGYEVIHLSHHIFDRTDTSNILDYQPTSTATWYKEGTTKWRDDYHRVGVFWRSPTYLEYYVDGKLVKTTSGDEIDPYNYSQADGTEEFGLTKDLNVILNMEDQTWRAAYGLSPTAEELANEEDCTFNIEWIRVYQLKCE